MIQLLSIRFERPVHLKQKHVPTIGRAPDLEQVVLCERHPISVLADWFFQLLLVGKAFSYFPLRPASRAYCCTCAVRRGASSSCCRPTGVLSLNLEKQEDRGAAPYS